MQKLIVASNSPRRQELIREAGFSFEVRTLEVDESLEEKVDVLEVAEYLACKKNQAYREWFTNGILLTADTVVISNDQILGKPNSDNEAFEMIDSLSGKEHLVMSGVCISNAEKKISFSDSTSVIFEQLDKEEISYYIEKYQPFDKAGSYGIQEWLGMIGIKSIQGSFYNVMGLPIHLVYSSLKNDFGITLV